MRFIPTIFHGIFDLLLAVLVLLAPWIFDYKSDGAETWGPSIIIAVMLAYSILTDYETGLIKILAMPAHNWFDVASGFGIIFSPWLFEFREVPHATGVLMTFGILIILNGLFTETLPSYAEAGKGG